MGILFFIFLICNNPVFNIEIFQLAWYQLRSIIQLLSLIFEILISLLLLQLINYSIIQFAKVCNDPVYDIKILLFSAHV